MAKSRITIDWWAFLCCCSCLICENFVMLDLRLVEYLKWQVFEWIVKIKNLKLLWRRPFCIWAYLYFTCSFSYADSLLIKDSWKWTVHNSSRLLYLVSLHCPWLFWSLLHRSSVACSEILLKHRWWVNFTDYICRKLNLIFFLQGWVEFLFANGHACS